MDIFREKATLTVTELTVALKGVIENQFRFFRVSGEISTLRTPQSGHVYFTLKDSHSQLKAVLFKTQKRYLAEKLQEGKNVICHGRLSLYEPRGEYQLIVDTVDFKGQGDLQAQFEALRKKLEIEGLFAPDRKKEIPLLAEHIALVTSPSGAAVQDFLKVVSQRNFPGKITIVPVTVQGRTSTAEIAEAIDLANELSLGIDVIVVVRGGGPAEDLWSFNEEKVARAIFSSTIPVVTGIGHETDCTIADLCADLHTHTPTAAAEATVANVAFLRESVMAQQKSLALSMGRFFQERAEKIIQLRRIIGSYHLYFSNQESRLEHIMTKLVNGMQSVLDNSSRSLDIGRNIFLQQSPKKVIARQQERGRRLYDELLSNMRRNLGRNREKLSHAATLLDSVSPLSVLARGYAIVTQKEQQAERIPRIIRNYEQVRIGDVVDVKLHQGSLACEVKEKKGNQTV